MRKRPRSALEEQLTTESVQLFPRIEFEPARLPDVPAAVSVAVRVLNPRSAAAGVDDAASAAIGGGGSSDPAAVLDGSGEAPGRLSSLPDSQHLFPPDHLESLLAWPHMRGVGPGLSNLGNTCFLNSTLQCLTYTAPLANLCVERAHSRRCRRKGFCTYCELEGHLRACHDNEQPQRSLAPRVLVSHVRSVAKHFRPGRQEDAHEYFLCLLEAIQAAAVRAAAAARGEPPSERISHTSEIMQLFGGRLRSQVACHACGRASSSYEPFLDVALELRRAPSVTEALRHFSQRERLHGDNQYSCPHCNGLRDASKVLQIHVAPRVLVLQLKRFGFGRYGSGKLQKHVRFNPALDLAPFCTPESLRASGGMRYQLYAVLVHEGRSMHGGHYYAYVQPASGGWYRCDDSRVAQVRRPPRWAVENGVGLRMREDAADEGLSGD